MRAGGEPLARCCALPLVAVGDVAAAASTSGAVVALAVQRLARSPGRSASRSRETTASSHLRPARLEPVGAALGLRLLAALVEAFERDRGSPVIASRASDFERRAGRRCVWRRRIDAPRARRRRAPRAAAAGGCSSTPSPTPYAPVSSTATRSPTSSGGSVAVAPERVAALAEWPDDVVAAAAPGRGRHRLDAVERAVERRAASARSCRRRGSTNRGAPGCAFTSTTRASSTPAGADEAAARARGRACRPGRAHDRQRRAAAYSAGVGRRRCRRRRCRGRRRDRGARARCRRRAARAPGATSASAARASGSSVGDLRADVDVEADELEARACRRMRGSSVAAPRRCGTPNLLMLQAGRDVRVALGVDVRIDAQRDARASRRARAASASMRSSSPADSTLIALTPRATALVELVARLADAGEHDLRRDRSRRAGRRRSRRRSWRRRALPRPRSRRSDGERRVGLERVVQGVRVRRERRVERAVARRG